MVRNPLFFQSDRSFDFGKNYLYIYIYIDSSTDPLSSLFPSNFFLYSL